MAKLPAAHLADCKSIDLLSNSIGDTGISALCDALSEESSTENSRLKRHTEAVPSRKVALALPALQFIDLRTNKIGKKGAASLADAVAKGNLPTGGLDLEGNSREALVELEELQKKKSPQRSSSTLSDVSDTRGKPDAAVPSPSPSEVLSLTTPRSCMGRTSNEQILLGSVEEVDSFSRTVRHTARNRL